MIKNVQSSVFTINKAATSNFLHTLFCPNKIFPVYSPWQMYIIANNYFPKHWYLHCIQVQKQWSFFPANLAGPKWFLSSTSVSLNGLCICAFF